VGRGAGGEDERLHDGLAGKIAGDADDARARMGGFKAARQGAVGVAVERHAEGDEALRAGLDPNDLKLVTAAFVFVALILPGLLQRLRARRAATSRAGEATP